jgi:ADP-ribose pyrophosphatase YjhB (NUDIX family)
MKNSCGAIFYAFDPSGQIGIILGEEGDDFLPFKGCNEPGETYEQTAIREIHEETCGLINISDIKLEHVFSTKSKIYRIGICQVPYSIVEQFNKSRLLESRKVFREKKELLFFPITTVLSNPRVHNISRSSIKYYWDRIISLSENNINTTTCNSRYHGMSENYANEIYKLTIGENPNDKYTKSFDRLYKSSLIGDIC